MSTRGEPVPGAPNRQPTADGRVGRLSGLLAALLPAFIALQAAAGAQLPQLLLRGRIDPALANQLGVAGAVVWLLMLVLACSSLWQQWRRPRRSLARLRLNVVAAGTLLNALSLAALGWLLQQAGPELLVLDAGLQLVGDTGQSRLQLGVLGALAALGGALALIGSASCWPLLSERFRRRLWLAVDLLLVGLVTWALATLPARPAADDPDALVLPVVRHVITTLGVLRALARLLPRLLDIVELLGFRALVASRHLRAKKSGFLATISVLSVLAVTLSCSALTITLSVMGGFRHDLKRKILGNNAHIVIDRERGDIEAWKPLLKRASSAPGVIGASPFVSGEVMISSASNLATAVLRGIDLHTVGDVNDLRRNLRSGKLEYLEKPEMLLDLPPDLPRGGMLPSLTPPAPSPTPEDEDPLEAAERMELEKKLAELERFLHDTRKQADAETDPDEAPPPRDVLPGIVIGQELARSLRLYVGDEVNVVAPLGALGPSGPMPKSRPYRIAGIFYSGMYEYDMKFTYVELGQGQRFLGTGDAISGIEVKVQDTDRAPEIAATIASSLGREELRVQDWQRLNSRLFGALALEKLAMFITLGIAILVASFCIAGTLTLMVQEKGREVAVMKAMGAADRAIVGVFVIEGGLIGVLGAALGLFLGYMMCFAAEHFGIKMNPEVYYIERLPVHIDPGEFIMTGVSAVLICLLITIYPAFQASRLRPIDALRYE